LRGDDGDGGGGDGDGDGGGDDEAAATEAMFPPPSFRHVFLYSLFHS